MREPDTATKALEREKALWAKFIEQRERTLILPMVKRHVELLKRLGFIKE